MTKSSVNGTLLYPVFIISGFFYAGLHLFNIKIPFQYIIKIIPIIILIILTIINTQKSERILLLTALSFSAGGDVILGLNIENLFTAGLILFLIAHIFYILLFLKNFKFSKKGSTLSLPILIFSAVMGYLMRNIESKYFIPVIIYLAVISVMTICAAFYSASQKYNTAYFVLIGAALFMFSDSSIAVNKFLYTFPYSGVIIMTTYYAAQFFIVNGFVLKYKIKS